MAPRGNLRVVRDDEPPDGQRVQTAPEHWLLKGHVNRTAEERALLDKEYALLRHRSRRRFIRITLAPHLAAAIVAWSVPHVPFAVALAFAVTLATHVLVALAHRAPSANKD